MKIMQTAVLRTMQTVLIVSLLLGCTGTPVVPERVVEGRVVSAREYAVPAFPGADVFIANYEVVFEETSEPHDRVTFVTYMVACPAHEPSERIFKVHLKKLDDGSVWAATSCEEVQGPGTAG
jgi:hypothetical protein